MPSVIEFIQHTEIFPPEETLTNHPEILNALIDYISLNPDILLQNQQQCYAYPSKSSEILSTGSTFRALIQNKQKMNQQGTEKEKYYPYLSRLFENMIKNRKEMKELKEKMSKQEESEQLQIEQCLLGYTNRVLISLAKKTPEIYEYFKDKQEMMTMLVKDNEFLNALQQFWNIFMIESTMNLYVFLKNLFLRALMFRIIDETDTDNLVVYEILATLYDQISKKMQSVYLPEDEREELQEICGSFHDEDFVTLMILKISCFKSDKTYFIGKLFNSLLKNPLNNQPPLSKQQKQELQKKDNEKQEELEVESLNQNKHNSQRYALSLAFISQNYIQVMQEYFESYEDSSNFMDFIMPDQIELLKFMIGLSQKQVLAAESQANLLKRLLVYSSIHRKNSILHCMLLKLISIIYQKRNKEKVFEEINVIPFLMKNAENSSEKMNEGSRFSYHSLVFKVCKFWEEREDMLNSLKEDESLFVKEIVRKKQDKLANLQMYKRKKIDSPLTQVSTFNPQPQKQGTLPQTQHA